MGKMEKLDCKKITSIEEIKMILDCLDLHINEDAEHYEQLKHLVIK